MNGYMMSLLTATELVAIRIMTVNVSFHDCRQAIDISSEMSEWLTGCSIV